MTAIQFGLARSTNWAGYAGNATSGTLESSSSDNDFSFLPASDRDQTSMTASYQHPDRAIVLSSSWADFYCKDYAAAGSVTAAVQDGQGKTRYRTPDPRQVVRDGDNDNMQDGWERASITAFEAQYGLQVNTGLNFFSDSTQAVSDEYADVDSTPNIPGSDTDGGRNMVPHKTAGDSLTPFQEYRGFVLDGGGFDGGGGGGHDGGGGHGGGHKRLSPAYKEMLLEVDTTAGPAMLTRPELLSVLSTVARGYSNATTGAGIRVFWVVDVVTAANGVFTDSQARSWARSHSNAQLDEFVHLVFADKHATNSLYGVTYKKNLFTNQSGCFVFTTPLTASAPPADRLTWISNTAAHELGHAIIWPAGTGGFDGSEHVTDPDGDGVAGGGPGDTVYLMVNGSIRNRSAPIMFDDVTRRQIDLNYKSSVEN